MVDNELITKVRTRNVKSILSNVFTSSGGGGGTWGSITGTLSSQTDLQSALDDKFSLTNGGTLLGASVLLDGDGNTFTINNADVFTLGATTSLDFDAPAFTFSNGAVSFEAGTTGYSSLKIPHGVAPTSPVDGDFWSTTAGFFGRVNGATVGPFGTGGGGLTVGTTTITSGTNTRVLYNNSGVLGEYTVSGSGNVAMTTSPMFTTPILGTPTSGTLTNTTGYLFNNLAAATGANTINNVANAQEWQWNSLAAGTGLLLSSSSTAAASNTNTLFRVNQAGANATSTQTTYSGYFSNTKTGTSSTNVGLYSEASGGTTNLAVKTGTGSVLIGNALSDAITANTRLDVRGTGTSTELIQRWASSTNNQVLSVTNQGQISLSPSGGVAGLSWGGQAQVGSTSNGTSFTNNGTGILVYGSVSTTSNNVFTVLNNASLTATSGTQNSIMANVGFAPTSGTAAFNGYRLTSTINQTGGANGTVSMIALTPTYTAAGGDVYGFRYAPTVTSITGVHYSFSATSGLMALNASVAGSSSFRIPHGTAPSSPVDGDIWTTTAGLYVRINGATVGPLT